MLFLQVCESSCWEQFEAAVIAAQGCTRSNFKDDQQCKSECIASLYKSYKQEQVFTKFNLQVKTHFFEAESCSRSDALGPFPTTKRRNYARGRKLQTLSKMAKFSVTITPWALYGYHSGLHLLLALPNPPRHRISESAGCCRVGLPASACGT